MGEQVKLVLPDGASIGAYLAETVGKAKGAVVVIQEIFGVTPHIRSVADRFAAIGYTAIAPYFFDAVEPGTVLAYTRGDISRGRALARRLGVDVAVAAVEAAAQSVASAGKAGAVGFCWGGTIALLAAQRLGLPAVSYYGGRNAEHLDAPLKAPVMFHFGGEDASIPPEAIERHREHYPDAPMYVYPDAGHAFNRDAPGDIHYHPASAKLAWDRTLEFLQAQLAA